MSVLTDAQVAEFLKQFEGAPLEKRVPFSPAGGLVLIRPPGYAGRLAQSISGLESFQRAAVMLSTCVFKVDHKTEAPLPFATAEQWERIGATYYGEVSALLRAVLDLSEAERQTAEKKPQSPSSPSP